MTEQAKRTAGSLISMNPPSNQQINNFIKGAEYYLERERLDVNTSEEAKRVLMDTERLLVDVKTLLNNKNSDEKMQRVLIKGKDVTRRLSEKLSSKAQQSGGVQSQMTSFKQPVSDLSKDIKELGRRMIVSRDFRGIIIEIIDIVQGISMAIVGEKGENPSSSSSSSSSTNQSISSTTITSTNNTNMSNLTETRTTPITKQSPQYNEKSQLVEMQHVSQPLKGEESSSSNNLLIGGLTEDRMEDFASRILNVLARLKQREEFQKAISGLVHLIEQMKSRGTSTGKEMINSVQSDINEMEDILISIIKEFSNPEVVDDAFHKAKIVVPLIKDDPELRNYYFDTKTLIERILRDPQSNVTDHRRQIIDHIKWAQRIGQHPAHKEKYQMLIGLLRNLRQIFQQIVQDQDLRRLSQDAVRLAKDFVYTDRQGLSHINWPLLGEMKTIFLPMIVDSLRDITIPKIEGTSGKYDFRLDNIHISSSTLLPDNIHIEWYNDLDLALRKTSTDRAKSTLAIRVTNITAAVRDISFWYRKKTGIHWNDQGLVDVILSRRGLSLLIVIQGYSENELLSKRKSRLTREEKLFVRSVDVHLDKLRLRFRHSKHNTFYKIMTSLFGSMIKSRIESNVENSIRLALSKSLVKFQDLWHNLKLQARNSTTNMFSKAHQIENETSSTTTTTTGSSSSSSSSTGGGVAGKVSQKVQQAKGAFKEKMKPIKPSRSSKQSSGGSSSAEGIFFSTPSNNQSAASVTTASSSSSSSTQPSSYSTTTTTTSTAPTPTSNVAASSVKEAVVNLEHDQGHLADPLMNPPKLVESRNIDTTSTSSSTQPSVYSSSPILTTTSTTATPTPTPTPNVAASSVKEAVINLENGQGHLADPLMNPPKLVESRNIDTTSTSSSTPISSTPISTISPASGFNQTSTNTFAPQPIYQSREVTSNVNSSSLSPTSTTTTSSSPTSTSSGLTRSSITTLNPMHDSPRINQTETPQYKVADVVSHLQQEVNTTTPADPLLHPLPLFGVAGSSMPSIAPREQSGASISTYSSSSNTTPSMQQQQQIQGNQFSELNSQPQTQSQSQSQSQPQPQPQPQQSNLPFVNVPLQRTNQDPSPSLNNNINNNNNNNWAFGASPNNNINNTPNELERLMNNKPGGTIF